MFVVKLTFVQIVYFIANSNGMVTNDNVYFVSESFKQ